MPLSKEKLNKLKRLVSSETEILAMDLEEKIQQVEAKIKEPKDYSANINKLKEALLTLQSTFQNKIKALSNKDELENFKNSFESQLDELEEKIPEVEKYDDSVLKSEFVKEINELRKNVFSRLENLGGGNMNRQVKIEGVDVS